MKLLKKVVIFTVILVVTFLLGGYFWVNSASFSSFVSKQITKELKNKCKIGSISLSPGGAVQVKDFVLQDDMAQNAVAFDTLNTKINWLDLISGSPMPSLLKVNGLQLNLTEHDGLWSLAAINKLTKFRLARGESLNIADLTLDVKGDGVTYDFECGVKSAGVEPKLRASSLSAHGKFELTKLQVDQLKFNFMGGTVQSNLLATFDKALKFPLTSLDTRLIAKDISLRFLKPFLKDQSYAFDGQTSMDINLALDNGVIVSAGTMELLDFEVAHPVLTRILSLLETDRHFLVFKKGHVDFSLSNNLLKVSDASFLNDELITVISKNMTLELRNDGPEVNPFKLKPGHIYLPFDLMAPYKIVRVKSMRSKENKDVVKTAFEVEGQFDQLPLLLYDAVKEKSKEIIVNEVERHLNKLNEKLGNKLNEKLNEKLGEKLNEKLNDKLGDKLNEKLNDKLNEKLKEELNIKIGGEKVDLNQILDLF